MKKFSIFFGGVIILATLLSVTAFKALPPGPSANGQATLKLAYLNGTQHFSFHAKKNANGSVTGSFETKSPGQNIRVHGDIDCLNVLADGKTAIMGGVATNVDGNGFPIAVGDRIWFKVVDNGEGANSPRDQFTDYYILIPNCNNINFPLNPIEGGNIQVKP